MKIMFFIVYLYKNMLTKSGGQTGFANPSITYQHDHNFIRFAGGQPPAGSCTTAAVITHFSAGLVLTHYNGLRIWGQTYVIWIFFVAQLLYNYNMFYFSFYSSQILHDMYVHYISSKTTLKNIHVVSVCYADSFKNSTKGFSFALCPLSLPFFTLFIIFTLFLLPLSLSLSLSLSF